MAELIVTRPLMIFIISIIILNEPIQSIEQASHPSTTSPSSIDSEFQVKPVGHNGHEQEQHEKQNVTNSISSISLSDDPTSVVSVTSSESEQKRRVMDSGLYLGKRLLLTDRLYKLNVYLDPICEQIDTLTSKQLTRVALQIRQFINHVSRQ